MGLFGTKSRSIGSYLLKKFNLYLFDPVSQVEGPICVLVRKKSETFRKKIKKKVRFKKSLLFSTKIVERCHHNEIAKDIFKKSP